jgi:hypothetical protein
MPGPADPPAAFAPTKPGPGRQCCWASLLCHALALLAGLYLFPLRLMGPTFRYLPGDAYDSRFNNYVLEHGYQVLLGRQPSFWDPPFFYPEPNVLAYSDSHLGTLPLYAVLRWAGCDRESAFQGWFLTLCALNYLAAAWALERLGLRGPAAAAGAYVFAFGMPGIAQTVHAQLLPRLGVPLAFAFAVGVLRGGGWRAWLGLGASVLWQFYAAIYTGYFLVLVLAAFAVPYALLGRRGPARPAGWPGQWRRWFLQGSVTLALGVAALLPLMRPYLEVARDHDPRQPEEILSMLPRPRSWVSPPRRALLWSRLHPQVRQLPNPGEHQLFLGALPVAGVLAALAAVPLWAAHRRVGRRRRLAGAAALAVAAVFLGTLYTESFCLYAPFITLPGVNAIRAVSRIGLVVAFPAAVAVAFWLAALARGGRRGRPAVVWTVQVVLLALAVADQVVWQPSPCGLRKQDAQERARRLADAVQQQDPEARVFLNAQYNSADGRPDGSDAFAGQQLDAMMAAQLLGIPTLNGYSGWWPHNWARLADWSRLENWKIEVAQRLTPEWEQRTPWYPADAFTGLVVVGSMGRMPDGPMSRGTAVLPPGAFRADLAAPGAPRVLKAGTVRRMVLTVRNRGTTCWPALGLPDDYYRIGLAYRWQTPHGQEVTPFDANRTWLPHDLPPGAEARLDVRVRVPAGTGHYLLEFDLVQEHVGWFRERGFSPLRLEVSATPVGR